MANNTALSILLIEDNPGDAELLLEMAERCNPPCIFERADRLSSGLGLMTKNLFDIVLLDLDLPDSSGIDTLRGLQEKGPELPVIVLTGIADEELATQAISMGAQDYLIKGDIDSNLLMRAIRYAIERKRSELALRESEARLRGIASAASDAVILIDNDGNVLFWNGAATKMFGYTNEEIEGRDLHSFIMPGRFADSFTKGFQKFRLTGEGPLIGKISEIEAKRKDGVEFPVELSLSALSLKGKWTAIGIVRDITRRKRLEEEIMHMASHDPLTGLPNRRLFMDIINIEIAEARRSNEKVAVFFLDLDRFKEVNDTLGHETGDELLKTFANRLRSGIRESDTVARIGGDEFSVVLARISHVKDIVTVVRKVMDSVGKPYLISGHHINVTASIGISIYPDDSKEVDILFRFADIAMYHAKEMGRNTFQFYSQKMNVQSGERMRMERYLRKTIELGELVLHYQPRIDMRSGEIICAEALVRWNHPEMGLLEPGRFIPLAEETGFVASIDEWVLRTACGHILSLQDAGLPAMCITVNISSRQFRSAELVAVVSRILEETGVPPHYLGIEITESAAMSNIEHTIDRFRELAALGLHISIDDFGTGYSSLSYLKRLPLDSLKIDLSFVRNISTDSDDRALIRAVIAMAHNMKFRVVAEGVETEEQLSFLNSANCDEAQGYLFSRPLPPGEFIDEIKKAKKIEGPHF